MATRSPAVSLSEDAAALVLESTGATAILSAEVVQSLWDGYGELSRVRLAGASGETVILKDVRPPAASARSGSSLSHQRKRRSYEVEVAFYGSGAARTDERCRVARPFAAAASSGGWRLVLEDLSAAGFPERARRGAANLVPCVGWLATFHARFLGEEPTALWPTGTYWHLATRLEELGRTEDAELVEVAPALDRALEAAQFKTWVHGDAKPANFCFSADHDRVAAVDFQYVGGGCGMKDIAYLLYGDVSREDEAALVDDYFAALRRELAGRDVDAAALEAEWRRLYPVAYADFVRFLAGWSPGSFDARGRARVREAARGL